jgi:hypothetical protein
MQAQPGDVKVSGQFYFPETARYRVEFAPAEFTAATEQRHKPFIEA